MNCIYSYKFVLVIMVIFVCFSHCCKTACFYVMRLLCPWNMSICAWHFKFQNYLISQSCVMATETYRSESYISANINYFTSACLDHAIMCSECFSESKEQYAWVSQSHRARPDQACGTFHAALLYRYVYPWNSCCGSVIITPSSTMHSMVGN